MARKKRSRTTTDPLPPSVQKLSGRLFMLNKSPTVINPSFAPIRRLISEGRFREALTELEGRTYAAEREYRVLSARAVCLVGIGDHAGALAEIDRAERSLLDMGEAVPARDHAGIHCNRANILKDMDRIDDALASAEEAIRTDPGWALSHIMAIAVHASVNDFAAAREAFLRMGQHCPDYLEDEGARAYLLSDLDFATVRRHPSFTEFFKELDT